MSKFTMDENIPEEDEEEDDVKEEKDKAAAAVVVPMDEIVFSIWRTISEGKNKDVQKIFEAFEDRNIPIHDINEDFDPDGGHLLIFCVKNGCVKGNGSGRDFIQCARILIEKGIDLDIQDKAERTALHWSVFYRNTAFVSLLVNAGADVDIFDHDGHTPFIAAVMAGHCDIIKTLTVDQTDNKIFSSKDRKGTPALVIAVQKGHLDVCQVLLENGAEINVTDRKLKRTALQYAVIQKRLDIFDLILKYKPRLEKADYKGKTALHRICAIKDPRYFQKVLRVYGSFPGQLMEQEAEDGVTPVILACQNGNSQQLKELLDQGASVTSIDDSGRTALHYCADNLETQCAEMLLMKDSSLLEIKDSQGFTPLHMSVISGNSPLLKLLLKKGADLKSLDNELHTPAHWATVCGHLEILDVLIEAGAELSTPDSHNAYPIHYAAQMNGKENGHSDQKIGEKVLKKLLDSGVPYDVTDKDGRQPLLWAASAGNIESCRYLVKSGADPNAIDKDGLSAIHCAASRGHTKTVDELKKLGSEVNLADKNNCTALFYSITLGNKECTKTLLKYGADPNHRDVRGRTPSHCASVKGCIDTVKMLDKSKADLWDNSVRGDRPIHEAAQGGHCDVVKYLLKWKNQPEAVNTSNSSGRTCLHIAAIVNNLPLCKLLLDNGADRNAIMTHKDKNYTPYDAAVLKENHETAEYIKAKGGITGGDVDNIVNKKEKRDTKSAKSRKSTSSLTDHPDEKEEEEQTDKDDENTEERKEEEKRKQKEAAEEAAKVAVIASEKDKKEEGKKKEKQKSAKEEKDKKEEEKNQKEAEKNQEEAEKNQKEAERDHKEAEEKPDGKVAVVSSSEDEGKKKGDKKQKAAVKGKVADEKLVKEGKGKKKQKKKLEGLTEEDEEEEGAETEGEKSAKGKKKSAKTDDEKETETEGQTEDEKSAKGKKKKKVIKKDEEAEKARKEAEKAKKDAVKAHQEAEKAKAEAEIARLEKEKAEREKKKASKEKEKVKEETEKASKDKKGNKEKAVAAAVIAEKAKQEAEQKKKGKKKKGKKEEGETEEEEEEEVDEREREKARLEAERLKREADQSREAAEKARLEAERLRKEAEAAKQEGEKSKEEIEQARREHEEAEKERLRKEQEAAEKEAKLILLAEQEKEEERRRQESAKRRQESAKRREEEEKAEAQRREKEEKEAQKQAEEEEKKRKKQEADEAKQREKEEEKEVAKKKKEDEAEAKRLAKEEETKRKEEEAEAKRQAKEEEAKRKEEEKEQARKKKEEEREEANRKQEEEKERARKKKEEETEKAEQEKEAKRKRESEKAPVAAAVAAAALKKADKEEEESEEEEEEERTKEESKSRSSAPVTREATEEDIRVPVPVPGEKEDKPKSRGKKKQRKDGKETEKSGTRESKKESQKDGKETDKPGTRESKKGAKVVIADKQKSRQKSREGSDETDTTKKSRERSRVNGFEEVVLEEPAEDRRSRPVTRQTPKAVTPSRGLDISPEEIRTDRTRSPSPFRHPPGRDKSVQTNSDEEFEVPDDAPDNELLALELARKKKQSRESVLPTRESNERRRESPLRSSKVKGDGRIHPGLLRKEEPRSRTPLVNGDDFDDGEISPDEDRDGPLAFEFYNRRKRLEIAERLAKERQRNREREEYLKLQILLERSKNDRLKQAKQRSLNTSSDMENNFDTTLMKKKPVPRRVNSIQESVRRYQDQRRYVRQLHQLKRAQIYTGPMHDIVLFSKLMDVYKHAPGDSEQDLDLTVMENWDGYLRDQLRFVSHFYEDDRPEFRSISHTAKEQASRLAKSASDARRRVDSYNEKLNNYVKKIEEQEQKDREDYEGRISNMAKKTQDMLDDVQNKASNTLADAKETNATLDQFYRRERSELMASSRPGRREHSWLKHDAENDDRQSRMEETEKARKERYKEWHKKKNEELRRKLMKVYGNSSSLQNGLNGSGATKKEGPSRPFSSLISVPSSDQVFMKFLNSRKSSSMSTVGGMGPMKASTPRVSNENSPRPKSMISSFSGSRAQYNNSDQEINVHMTEFGMRRVKMEDGSFGVSPQEYDAEELKALLCRRQGTLSANWTPKYDGDVRPRAGLVFVEPRIYDEFLREERMQKKNETSRATNLNSLGTEEDATTVLEPVETS
ncbi:hypothetical protein FSP39_010347 [Pinctada imbricata]|uniref:Uncharacterized protein n=1 Tax=Pinctada imbricata TaxID=66713 RepID=A0AA88XW95_PINIB|nr:hypothetical protein FSP39_010347 [Pinctada imbricata]